MTSRLQGLRDNYPAACFKCGEALDGPPDDEALQKQIDEHDELFPGEPLEHECVICDQCFHTYCPGGKKIGMN